MKQAAGSISSKLPTWLSGILPVCFVLCLLIIVWYIASVLMNSDWQRQTYERAGVEPDFVQFVSDSLSQDRPVLPSPHQVLNEIYKTTFLKKITSKRSLIYHAGITLSSTMLGFLIGTILGILLAVAIIHMRSLDRSLMPWIIFTQTVPILAIAPMIIVVLYNIGIQGLLPKALISAYLSFFPVAVSMVKGFRSPDKILVDLMRTYSATDWQIFWKLRWPSSVPYLFASMKLAIAVSLVGAIVGELPTGAVAGLGARLLAGSYYGQTTQIWSALVLAALISAVLVSLIGWLGNRISHRMGMTR